MSPISILKAVTESFSPRGRALAQLKKQVEYHRQQLSRFSPDGSEEGFASAMDGFLEFIHTYPHRDVYLDFERSPQFIQYQQFFLPYMLRLAWQMEDLTFADMISQDLDSEQKLGDIHAIHTKHSYARIEDAVNLADLSNCQSYVMLGCGKVPSSMFYVHDWTDIPRIVGVDNNEEAVIKATQICRKFGLDRISIEQADAGSFDLSSFDAIYWGQFCTPRKKVMENIIKTAKKNCKIILREPFHTGTLGTESILPSLDPRLEICGESEDLIGRFMLKHYILRLN